MSKETSASAPAGFEAFESENEGTFESFRSSLQAWTTAAFCTWTVRACKFETVQDKRSRLETDIEQLNLEEATSAAAGAAVWVDQVNMELDKMQPKPLHWHELCLKGKSKLESQWRAKLKEKVGSVDVTDEMGLETLVSMEKSLSAHVLEVSEKLQELRGHLVERENALCAALDKDCMESLGDDFTAFCIWAVREKLSCFETAIERLDLEEDLLEHPLNPDSKEKLMLLFVVEICAECLCGWIVARHTQEIRGSGIEPDVRDCSRMLSSNAAKEEPAGSPPSRVTQKAKLEPKTLWKRPTKVVVPKMIAVSFGLDFRSFDATSMAETAVYCRYIDMGFEAEEWVELATDQRNAPVPARTWSMSKKVRC
ncbi:hypothetical protein AK812_SmicGene38135 [Symbiodinium microadriaticum]|uniref:Uncharacterized protein n=1 Tax=Symbiodinium microadriaticum TaxID=2951 RepID=A0A1Q9CEH5_SYMMI|nr:hypothetical protein AK812_SmicGene38135 [Symbiodinium microadriaticum]